METVFLGPSRPVPQEVKIPGESPQGCSTRSSRPESRAPRRGGRRSRPSGLCVPPTQISLVLHTSTSGLGRGLPSTRSGSADPGETPLPMPPAFSHARTGMRELHLGQGQLPQCSPAKAPHARSVSPHPGPNFTPPKGARDSGDEPAACSVLSLRRLSPASAGPPASLAWSPRLS